MDLDMDIGDDGRGRMSGDNVPVPRKIMKSKSQLDALERQYQEGKYPTEIVRQQLSQRLGLSDRQLQMWFSHRRRRDRREGILPSGDSRVNGTPTGSIRSGRGGGKQDSPPGSPRDYDEPCLDDTSISATVAAAKAAEAEAARAEEIAAAAKARALAAKLAAQEAEKAEREARAEKERRALAAAERERRMKAALALLAEPLRVDGPVLAAAFDPLPPGAFGEQHPYGTPAFATRVGLQPRRWPLVTPLIAGGRASKRPREVAWARERWLSKRAKAGPLVFPKRSPRYTPLDPSTLLRPVLLPPLEGRTRPLQRPIIVQRTLDALREQRMTLCNMREGVELGGPLALDMPPLAPPRPHKVPKPLKPVKVPGQKGRPPKSLAEKLAKLPKPPKPKEDAASKEAEAAERAQAKAQAKEAKARAASEERHARKEAERLDRFDSIKRKMEEKLARERRRDEERLQKEKAKEAERQEREARREKERAERDKLKEEQKVERDRRREEARVAADLQRAMAKKQFDDEQLESLELHRRQAEDVPERALSAPPETVTLPPFPPPAVGFRSAVDLVPWTATPDNANRFLKVWRFVTMFCGTLGAWPFSMDEFADALRWGDSRLLGELHMGLLRCVLLDVEEAKAWDAPSVPPLNSAGQLALGMWREAQERGFDLALWRKHLNAMTWPEAMRQLLLCAGYGPRKLGDDAEDAPPLDPWAPRKRPIMTGTDLPVSTAGLPGDGTERRPLPEDFDDREEMEAAREVVARLRSGAAARDAAAGAVRRIKACARQDRVYYSNSGAHEAGAAHPSMYVFVPGTIRHAVSVVLADAGAGGMHLGEIMSAIQARGLRSFSGIKNPDGLLSGVLSRDPAFVRVGPARYALMRNLNDRRGGAEIEGDAGGALGGAEGKAQAGEGACAGGEDDMAVDEVGGQGKFSLGDADGGGEDGRQGQEREGAGADTDMRDAGVADVGGHRGKGHVGGSAARSLSFVHMGEVGMSEGEGKPSDAEATVVAAAGMCGEEAAMQGGAPPPPLLRAGEDDDDGSELFFESDPEPEDIAGEEEGEDGSGSEGEAAGEAGGEGEDEGEGEWHDEWLRSLTWREYEELAPLDRLYALDALVEVAMQGGSMRTAIEDRVDVGHHLRRQLAQELAHAERALRKTKDEAAAPPPALPGTGAGEDMEGEGESLGGDALHASDGGATGDQAGSGDAHAQAGTMGGSHPSTPRSHQGAGDDAGRDMGTGAPGGVASSDPSQGTLEQPSPPGTVASSADRTGNAAASSHAARSLPPLASEAERHLQRAESLRRTEDAYGLRAEPLGLDRRFNRYFLFVAARWDPGCACDTTMGRLFMESGRTGDWSYLDTEQALDALMASLDVRGFRECALLEALQKHDESLRRGMRALAAGSGALATGTAAAALDTPGGEDAAGGVAPTPVKVEGVDTASVAGEQQGQSGDGGVLLGPATGPAPAVDMPPGAQGRGGPSSGMGAGPSLGIRGGAVAAGGGAGQDVPLRRARQQEEFTAWVKESVQPRAQRILLSGMKVERDRQGGGGAVVGPSPAAPALTLQCLWCQETVRPGRERHCRRCHATFATSELSQQQFAAHVAGCVGLVAEGAKEEGGSDMGVGVVAPGGGAAASGLLPPKLRKLKADILDLEAALPMEAVYQVWMDGSQRDEWIAGVRAAASVPPLLAALAELEATVRPEWWRHLSIARDVFGDVDAPKARRGELARSAEDGGGSPVTTPASGHAAMMFGTPTTTAAAALRLLAVDDALSYKPEERPRDSAARAAAMKGKALLAEQQAAVAAADAPYMPVWPPFPLKVARIRDFSLPSNLASPSKKIEGKA
eukprot:jgi/Mesvir1/25406/Mv01440-RA.1